jgi:hypothetical protein
MKRLFESKTIPLTLLAIALAFGVFLLWSRKQMTYAEVVKKYPVGTPAPVVLTDCGQLELKATGNIVSSNPTEEEKRRYIFFYVELPKSDAEIQFNYYRQVIRIARLSDRGKPR